MPTATVVAITECIESIEDLMSSYHTVGTRHKAGDSDGADEFRQRDRNAIIEVRLKEFRKKIVFPSLYSRFYNIIHATSLF